MSTRAFVIEDHPILRDVLVSMLSRMENLSVCGSAGSGEEALAAIPAAAAQMALVDISLPGMNGFELAVEIRTRWPEIACLMLSGYRAKGYAERARELGLQGYVAKGELAELEKAVRQVVAGGSYFMALD